MKQSLKKEVRERAKFCCEYCFAQMLFSADVFSIEHILPLVKGGLNILEFDTYSRNQLILNKYG